MIYFARIGDDGPIKIGTTEGVASRMVQLENHYARPLTILKVLPGGVEEERELHERFAHLRYRRTEQFRPAPELLDFIGRPLFATMDPDTIEVVEPKRYGTLVRVTDRTAEILRRVSRQEDISVAEFMTRYVEPVAEKRYGELIAKEARRLAGGPE